MTSVEVFISYSHVDEQFRHQIETCLVSLQRIGLINYWHDRMLPPGAKWEDQILDHVNNASVILLLISPDFVASDYCYGKEMQIALERHEDGSACTIPILVRNTAHWRDLPFGKLQALPKDAKPISNWRIRDKALQSVAEGIATAIKELRSHRDSRINAIPLSIDSLRRKSFAEIGLLVGGLVHNLSNPINGIFGCAQILKMRGAQKDLVESIISQCETTNKMLRNLMEKIRMEQDPEPKDVNLKSLIQTQLTFLRSDLYFKHNIACTIKCRLKKPVVNAVYVELSQVFGNLIRNSIEAIEARSTEKTTFYDGKIVISLAREDSDIVLLLEDNGCGFSEEESKNIFEPFFTTKQSSNSDSSWEGGGTGLGLYLSKQIIEKYGGSISIKSDKEGHKTIARVVLPSTKSRRLHNKKKADISSAQISGVMKSESKRSVVKHKARVLIVEDEPQIAHILAAILNFEGYDTVIALDADSALNIIKNSTPDIVIADHVMPGVTGLELARAVKKVNPQLPFILVSGYLNAEAESSMSRGLTDAFIPKQDLMIKLNQFLVSLLRDHKQE